MPHFSCVLVCFSCDWGAKPNEIADAHRGNGKRFIVRSDEKLSAFVELEREVLTVTFYLESIDADPCADQ